VAEATEKVADEVAEEYPGNESIKEAASKIKKVMDVIEEDTDKAEALIEKVSFITQSVASCYCYYTSDSEHVRLLTTAAAKSKSIFLRLTNCSPVSL